MNNERSGSMRFGDEFLSVPNDYRLNWFAINKDQNIADLKEYGIGGLTICVPYKDYLQSPEGWADYRRNVDACKEAGISLWIMDEWGYPSGMAGGLVVEKNPKLESMGLLMQKAAAAGGDTIVLDLPESALEYVYAAYYPASCDESGMALEKGSRIPVSENQVVITLPDGDDFVVCAFAKTYIFEGTHSEFLAANWKYSGHYPNLLLAEATKSFIELTYERYKENTPDLPSTLRIFYGDEPSLTPVYVREGTRPGGLPLIVWSDDIVGDFRRHNGYDLYNYLPALFEGDDDLSKTVRVQFYQIVADTLRTNWTKQIADWCAANGTNMSYHYFAEESLLLQVANYGDLMHVMEPMQIPSVDLGLRKPGLSRRGEITALRMVASVARHSGDKQTRSELDPLLGSFPDAKPTMAALRDNSNYCFAMGLDNMTTYGDWKNNGADIIEQTDTYKYIGRIEMFLRDAVYQNNVAIYYPIETYQADYIPSPEYIWGFYNKNLYKQDNLFDLDEQLMKKRISASYLSPQKIMKSDIEGGRIRIGSHSYDTLILVDVRVMSLEVAKRLKDFEESGGKLVWVGGFPVLSTRVQDHDALRSIFAGHEDRKKDKEEALEIACKRHRTMLHLAAGGPEYDDFLTAQVFKKDDATIFFIASLSEKPMIVDVDIDGMSDINAYNPVDGTSHSIVLPAKLEMGPSESWILTDK
ncbi:MAG: glycosyl hydrolase family 2 protein [Saccharofermentanales bacterium]